MGTPAIFGTKPYSYTQVAFGTVQTVLIEPVLNAYTSLFDLWVDAGATLQTLTILREMGRTSFTALAAAGQAVVNIAADPGVYSAGYKQTPTQTLYGFPNAPRTADNPIAAGDFVAYRCADGTYVLDTVASVSALAITLTTNLPTGGVLAGAPFWWFGLPADVNPYDAKAHPNFRPKVSTQTRFGVDPSILAGGWVTSPRPESPLVVHLNNITADTNSLTYTQAGWVGRIAAK